MNERRQVSEVWKWLANFLAGVVMTLIAAYFANGASKADVSTAVTSSNQVISARLENLNQSQKATTDEIRDLQKQVQTLSVAMGVDTSGVYINHHPRDSK